MAGKCWQPGEAKKFAKEARLNTPYYVINSHAKDQFAYEDKETYSVFTFTRHAPFTANKMTAGGTSAVRLCQVYGPVYDTPPSGVRHIAAPTPNCLDEGDLAQIRNAGREFGWRYTG